MEETLETIMVIVAEIVEGHPSVGNGNPVINVANHEMAMIAQEIVGPEGEEKTLRSTVTTIQTTLMVMEMMKLKVGLTTNQIPS